MRYSDLKERRVVLSVIEQLAGVEPDSAVGRTLRSRPEIAELSEAAYLAALQPRDPGAFSHRDRAAIAVRIAGLLKDVALESHYANELAKAPGTSFLEQGADLPQQPDLRHATTTVLRHVDLLTAEPRAARKEDIARLTEANLSETDVVRLAELIAFVNYQARVITGLKLLRGEA